MAAKKKVLYPKGNTIAGWNLGSRKETLDGMAEGNITSAKAKKLLAWVKQWAAWVAQEERRKKVKRG